MLMKAGSDAAQVHEYPALRFMASVGEPLNAKAVIWGRDTFGMPFHDNWWQTETGGIMIANFASMDVKPGAMGKPLPGIEAGIVDVTGDSLREVTEPMTIGELALRPGWPSMMRGYLHEEERYQKCFRDGWYLSGDLAMCDADGYYWFVGRSKDLIKSSGHLIGPFEVESALMEHEAVAEVGVIGVPDDTAGEIVKAYIALKSGFEPDEDLRLELLGHARKRLGPAVAPREIAFRQNLPKTRSGKIMRRLLKARELGLPEGDISTLESDEA
jgi:acetyl-CoA synthetase